MDYYVVKIKYRYVRIENVK